MTAASVELDDLYENAWHSVAKPPLRRSTISRGMPLSMRALSVSPRGADAVGSLSGGERRYGRYALSNTSSECVLAKANEADCFANAEVQTREEGGKLQLELNGKHLKTNLKISFLLKSIFILAIIKAQRTLEVTL